MNVVAYCRYSSENQRDGYSIEAQKKAICEFCKRNNYTIINFYVDEAKSGMNDEREQFQKMISDSLKHEFNGVVVHKLDRFSRDRYNSVIYRKKLKENGVKLISVLENIDDDNPEDLILLSVLEGMADYYSKNLSREVKKGMNEAAKNGMSTGGITPFGYKINKETKKYEIIPERAECVRMMFKMFINGYSCIDIEKKINELGFRTINGNLWDKKQIAKLLKREAYTGVKIYNQYRDKNCTGMTRSELIRVENAFPAIIDKTTFMEAQNIFIKNKRVTRPKRKGNEYLLTGLLTCKYCGKNFTGCCCFRNSSSGRVYHYYYVCGGKRDTKNGKCQSKRYPQADLENKIIDVIKNFIFTDKAIETWANAISKVIDKKEDPSVYIKQLDKTKSQKDKLLDLYLEGVIDKDTFRSKENELLNSIYSLETKINSCNVKTFTIDELKLAIKLMIDDLKNESADRKTIVKLFVKKISIDNISIDITLKLPNMGADKGLNGGARGIRTLAPVTRSTSLAGKPLEPLEYYSNCQMPLHFTIIKNKCQAQLLNLSENNRGS